MDCQRQFGCCWRNTEESNASMVSTEVTVDAAHETALHTEWQEKCLSLPHVLDGGNLLYSLPTSGGKTLVAEILLLRQLLLRERDAIFVLPYVSIVQEKVV